jgi:superfamily I DNA/RNA helicase
MPWEPGPDGTADLEEERRLFYVGLTRASRQVFLSRARERTLWGQKRRPQFSIWLRLMPPEVLERPALPPPRTRSVRQPQLFPEISSPRGKKSRK